MTNKKEDKYSLVSYIYAKKFDLLYNFINSYDDSLCDKCFDYINLDKLIYNSKVIDNKISINNNRIGFIVNLSNFFKIKIGILLTNNLLLTSNCTSNDDKLEDYTIFVNEYLFFWIKPLNAKECYNSLNIKEDSILNDIKNKDYCETDSYNVSEIKNYYVYSINIIYTFLTQM